jgi:Family of unknown function (DUF6104)
MYFTDRGIEELERRRGEDDVSLSWVAERLREFVDVNPEFEAAIERLATWLARLDDVGDDDIEGDIEGDIDGDIEGDIDGDV